MSDMTPESWPGLGARDETMPAPTGDAAGEAARYRDVMDAIDQLAPAVNSMAARLKDAHEQLGTVQAWKVRATRRGTISIIIAVLLFCATGAAFRVVNDNKVSQCQATNQVRSQAAGLWSYLVHISPPAAHETAAARAAQEALVAKFLGRVSYVYRPVQCRGIFG